MKGWENYHVGRGCMLRSVENKSEIDNSETFFPPQLERTNF